MLAAAEHVDVLHNREWLIHRKSQSMELIAHRNSGDKEQCGWSKWARPASGPAASLP